MSEQRANQHDVAELSAEERTAVLPVRGQAPGALLLQTLLEQVLGVVPPSNWCLVSFLTSSSSGGRDDLPLDAVEQVTCSARDDVHWKIWTLVNVQKFRVERQSCSATD
jgi:hypothetical protein